MEEPSSPSEVTEAKPRKNEEDLEEKEEEVKTDRRVTVAEGGIEEGEDQTENVPSGPRVSKEEAVKRLFEQVLWDANQENLKNFFLAHRLFIETKKLLELWLALFRLSPEKVEATGSKRVISLQRDRLLSVLIKWVKLQRTELLPYRQFVIESLEQERRQKLVKYRTRRGSFLVLLPDTNNDNKEERVEEGEGEDRETSRHVTIAEDAVRKEEAQEESEDGICVEQLVKALPAEAEVINSVDEFLWTELQSSFLTTSSSGEGVDGVRPHRIRLETLAGPKAKLPLTSVRSYSSFEASKQNDAAVAKNNDVSSSQPVVTRQQRHRASPRQKWVRGGPVLPSPSSVVGASSSPFAAGAKERKGETSTAAFLGSRRLIAAASTAVLNSSNKDAEERKETSNTKPEEQEEKRTEDKTTSAEGSGDDANNEQDKNEGKEDNAKRPILKNNPLSAPSTPRADERPSLLKVHSSRQAVSHSALQTSSSRQRAQTLAMTNNNNSAMEDPTNLDTAESIKQRVQERKEREVDRRQRIALKHWDEISSSSCTALARELTAYDYDLFMKIPDSEFFEWQRSGSNDKAYHCPNIVAFIRRFDEVSFWVSTAILIQLTHKDRRKVVKSMIKLAKELHGIGNYNGLIQIISGLNNSYVQRLKSLWQDGALPDKYISTFQDLEAVCSPLHNFTHYRKEFKERQAPKLPYFALFLRDLTIIKEANSLYTEEGLINSGLVQLTADFIRHFRSCHKTASPYHRLRRMTRDPALTSKLSYLYHVDEETLSALSSKIQPTKINTFAIEEVYSDEGAVINTPHPSGAVSDTAAESMASPADVEDIEHRDRALSQESYERYVRSGTLKFENERCLLLRADSLCGCLLRENQDGRWGSMQPDHLITFLYDHSYSMGKNDAVGVLTAFPNLHQQLSYLPLHWNVNKTLANIPKETQETLRFLDAAIFHCAHTGWGLAIVIDRPRDESATTQTPRPDLASSFPSSCSFECFQLTNNEATTYFPMRTEADLNAFCVLIDLEHSFEAESFLKRSPQLSGCYRRPRTPILQRRSRSPSPRRSSSSPSTQCKPSAVSNKRSSSPTKQFSSSSTSSSPSLSSSAPSTTPMPKLYTPLSSSPSPSSSTSPSVTFKSLALEMSQVATTIQNKTAAIKKKKRKEKKPTQEWRRSHRTRRKNEEDDERSAASCRCAMFAGYIGGWMEGCRRHFMENDEQPNERRKEGTNGPSADNPRLVAAEVLCRAKGDETCRFLLAYSPFIHQKVQQYFENQEEQQTKEEEEEDAEAEVRALTFDLPAGFLELDDRKEDGTEETKKTETKKLNNKENAGSNKRLPPYLVPHVREEILSSIATRTEPILKAANPTKAEEEVHNKQHSLIRNSTNSERKDTLKNMETESQIHLQVQTFKTWKRRQKKVMPAFTALLQDMRLEPSNGVIIMKQKRVLSPRSSEQTQQPSGEEARSPRMGRILTSPRSSITANNKERFVLLRNSFLWQPEEGEQDHWKELKYTLGHTLGKSDQRYFSSKLNTVLRLAIPSSTSMEGDAEGRAAFEEVVAKRVLGLTTVMARTGWGVPSFDFYDCNLGDIPSPRRTVCEDETKEENDINETVNEFCVKLFVTSSLEAEVFLRQHRKASDKDEQDRRKEGEGNNEQTNSTQMRNSRSASTSARVDHLRLDSPVTNLSRDSFSVPPDNKTQLYSSSPVCLTCAGYCGGFVEEAFAANAHPHHQRAPSSPSPSPPAGMEGEQPSPPPSPSSRQPHHQPCKVAAVEVACEGMGHSCCELILGSSGSIFRHIWKHLQETGTVNMWPRLNLIPLIDESNVKDYVLYDRLYRSLSLERQSSVDVADTEGDVEAEQKKKQGTESKEDALAQLKGEQENNNKAKDKDLQEKLQIVMERVKELKEGANKVNIAEETEKENSLATLAEGMSASRLLLLERLRAATVECGISSEEEEKKKQAGETETEAAVAEQEEAEEEEDDESVDFYAWVAELRRRGGRGSEDEKRKKERIFREKMKRLSLMDHASSQPTINVIPRTGSSNAAGGGLRGSKRRSLVSKKEKKEVHSPQLQRKEEKQKTHGSKRKSFGGLLVGALGTSSSPASSAEHSATANEENDDGKLKQAERTVPTNSPAKSKKSKKEQKLLWLKRDIMFGKVKDENHKVMTKEKKQSENERKRQKRMRRKSSHLPSTIVKTLKKQEEEPLEENDKQGGETKQRKGTMLRQQELNALKMMGQISLVDQLSDTNAVLSVDGTLATTPSPKTGGGERRNNLTI